MEAYIFVTLEPEQVTPFHDWPHGSPPLAVHPVSTGGEYMLLNMTLRAAAAKQRESSCQVCHTWLTQHKANPEAILGGRPPRAPRNKGPQILNGDIQTQIWATHFKWLVCKLFLYMK